MSSLGAFIFCHGDREQTFDSDVAGGAGPLYLVATAANSVARYSDIGSVYTDFGVGEWLDNLGAEISRGSERTGVDAELG